MNLVFNAVLSMTFILIVHVLIKKEILQNELERERQRDRQGRNARKGVREPDAEGSGTTPADDDDLLRYVATGDASDDEEEDEQERFRGTAAQGEEKSATKSKPLKPLTAAATTPSLRRVVSSAYAKDEDDVLGDGAPIRTYPDEKGINGGRVYRDMDVRGYDDGGGDFGRVHAAYGR